MAALTSLCRRRALRVIQAAGDDLNGYEAWRRLSKTYLQDAPQRRITALRKILNFDFKGDFQEELVTWENLVAQYDKILGEGEQLQDQIMITVVVQGSPTRLREHLQVNASPLPTYGKVRAAIKSFLTTQPFAGMAGAAKGQEKKAERNEDAMDVDSLEQRGKGKGKGGKGRGGKGPQKGYQKGDEKGGKGKAGRGQCLAKQRTWQVPRKRGRKG